MLALASGPSAGRRPPGPAPAARGELAGRLRSRRGEIEEAMRARVGAISDPAEVADPAYAQGLRSAVSAALEHGIEGLSSSESHPPPVPVALLAQARLAARNRIGIEVVMRRYLAGYTLLGDFLVEEAEASGLGGSALKRLLRSQAALLDRLLAAVSAEHAREGRPSPASAERRRLALVQRLLAGEFVDPAELRYPLEAHHLGLLCAGRGAEELLRGLAAQAGLSLLAVRPDPETLWAWLGGTRLADVVELAVRRAPAGIAIAIGEPGEGLAGWRLTHRQAAAALTVARCGSAQAVRYADVALLACALQDELLTASLRRLYLEPLEDERDGGAIARETLRSFLGSNCNVTATAAKLGVARKTVSARLRAVERLYGCSLVGCAADLEVALRLHELSADPEVSDRAILPAMLPKSARSVFPLR